MRLAQVSRGEKLVAAQARGEGEVVLGQGTSRTSAENQADFVPARQVGRKSGPGAVSAAIPAVKVMA